jgi:methylthioribose-1-phosphate isomerase
MGAHGAALMKPGSRVLTHCNAGALATGGYGTALGVIRSAFEQGKILMVYADETRPYLQGARLTAWELLQDGIPVTVLVDSAAGYLISQGGVDCIIVGADRIARNGDVANKIGTYTLACLADLHRIPFYVAAPTSTFDLSIPDRSGIPVEMRAESEVLSFRGMGVAPQGAKAFNPAFDLTPGRLISAIITERGVITPPIGENLPKIVLGDDFRA